MQYQLISIQIPTLFITELKPSLCSTSFNNQLLPSSNSDSQAMKGLFNLVGGEKISLGGTGTNGI